MPQLLRFTISVVFCVVLSLSLFGQSRWIFVGTTDDYSFWYVDQTIQRKSPKIIAAWEKVVYENKSYGIGLNEWNCSAKMKRLIQAQSYNSNGDLTNRSLTPLPWRYIVPDSVEEQTYKIVCDNSANSIIKKHNSADPTARFVTAQIVVKNTNLLRKPDINGDVVREVSFGEKFIMIVQQALGNWYYVMDLETNSRGWLYIRDAKIVQLEKATKKPMVNRTK